MAILSLGLLLGLLVWADVGEGVSGLDVKRSTNDWMALDKVGIMGEVWAGAGANVLGSMGSVLFSTGACDCAESW